MKTAIDGLEFDYEHGSTMTFVTAIDPSKGLKVIPYQLRMLQENRIARLLSMTTEEVNGVRLLRFDYSGKRRFIQMLRTEPPEYKQFLELVYLLVKTLAECSEYMLNENGFVLHEEMIFVGQRVADFQLCYVPVEGRIMRSITEQLRCLIIKMLGTIQAPIDSRFMPVLAVISEEPYSLIVLKQLLQRIWLESDVDPVPGKREDQTFEKGEQQGWQVGYLFRSLKGKLKLTKAELPKESNLAGKHRGNNDFEVVSGKTEFLSVQEKAAQQITLSISRNGIVEKQAMIDERFMIGRSPRGVHYTDPSEGVSRVHCELVKGENGLEVKDLGSLNGTSLNGETLIPYKTYPFIFGDVLKYVRTEIRLVAEG